MHCFHLVPGSLSYGPCSWAFERQCTKHWSSMAALSTHYWLESVAQVTWIGVQLGLSDQLSEPSAIWHGMVLGCQTSDTKGPLLFLQFSVWTLSWVVKKVARWQMSLIKENAVRKFSNILASAAHTWNNGSKIRKRQPAQIVSDLTAREVGSVLILNTWFLKCGSEYVGESWTEC